MSAFFVCARGRAHGPRPVGLVNFECLGFGHAQHGQAGVCGMGFDEFFNRLGKCSGRLFGAFAVEVHGGELQEDQTSIGPHVLRGVLVIGDRLQFR